MPDEPPPIIDYADRAPVWMGGGRRWSVAALVIGTAALAVSGLTVSLIADTVIRGGPGIADGVATALVFYAAVPALVAGGVVLVRLDPAERPKRGIPFLQASLAALVIALTVRVVQLRLGVAAERERHAAPASPRVPRGPATPPAAGG